MTLATHNIVTVVEVGWSAISVCGLLTTLWLLRESIRDRTALILAKRNGPALLLANGLVRTELLRVLQLLLMVILGLVAIYAPQPISDHAKEYRLLAGWVLTFIAIIITSNAVLDRAMRVRIDQEILKLYKNGRQYKGIGPIEDDS